MCVGVLLDGRALHVIFVVRGHAVRGLGHHGHLRRMMNLLIYLLDMVRMLHVLGIVIGIQVHVIVLVHQSMGGCLHEMVRFQGHHQYRLGVNFLCIVSQRMTVTETLDMAARIGLHMSSCLVLMAGVRLTDQGLHALVLQTELPGNFASLSENRFALINVVDMETASVAFANAIQDGMDMIVPTKFLE